jgi:hypothetical protein
LIIFKAYGAIILFSDSLLMLDKKLAKKTDAVLLAKIENDGFNLGI